MRAAIDMAAGIAANISNPLEGVTPSIAVFGATFSSRTTLILGGIWAVVLVAAAAAVLVGGGKWAWASRVAHSPDGVMEAAGQFKVALIAFACVSAASLILGALIWLVQG